MATIWNPGSSVGASPVLSVAGKTGEVTLEITDVTALASQLANKQPLLGYTPQNVAAKGVALGYAPLDGSGIVPDIHLPPETVTSVAGKTGDITLTTSDISGLTTALAGKEDSLGYTPEDSANRGAADGYAPLGPDSKIPSAYLPVDGTYKGIWNASTNTPTITSGVGVNGDFYIVGTAGTTSIDGTASWSEGDQIRFNGTIWQKIPTSSAVTSVAGKTGVVTLVQADISGLVTALAGKEPLLGYTPEDAADKGAANGYAPLGADSKVPSLYLPADAVTSVAGKTGAVTLVATDISDSTSAGRDLLKAASASAQRSLIGANDAANLTTGTVASARLNSSYTNLQTIRPQILQIGVDTNSRKTISYSNTHNPSTNIYELGRVVLGGDNRTVLIKGYIWAAIAVNYAANEFLISIRRNTPSDKYIQIIQTQFRQPHAIQIRVYEDPVADEVVIAYTGSSFSCQNIVCEIQQLERVGYNSFTPVTAITTFAPGGYTEITGRIIQPFDTKVFDVTSYGADKSGTTNSSSAINSCISAAIAAGGVVFWPSGSYLASSNITNFHDVKHVGYGQIVIGADTFYISPDDSTTNKIYVATTGSNTNDGLVSTRPIRTLQRAVDVLSNYGPVLAGTWTIQLAAGTYARGRFPSDGLFSIYPINISGPDVGGHPNVPTAIISEGANGISAEAIRIRERTSVRCTNLKFIGFNGTSSSGGFAGSGYCRLYTENCHFENCTWGISALQHSHLDVKGGIFDGNGYDSLGNAYSAGGGIRGLFSTKFSVGLQNGVLTNGPKFINNNFGIFAQEHINGHVDYCTFEDNKVAVRLNVCSRLNLGGSSFVRSTAAAILAQQNSVVSLSANNVFGSGADANYANIAANTGAAVDYATILTLTNAFASTERCVERKIINQVVNSTSATVLYQAVLKANIWREEYKNFSALKSFRFKLYGTLNGTTGYKRIQLRFGPTPCSVTFTTTETGIFEAEGKVFVGNNPVGTQLLTVRAARNGGTGTRLANATSSEALTSDTNLNIEALVQFASDDITVAGLELWVDGI